MIEFSCLEKWSLQLNKSRTTAKKPIRIYCVFISQFVGSVTHPALVGLQVFSFLFLGIKQRFKLISYKNKVNQFFNSFIQLMYKFYFDIFKRRNVCTRFEMKNECKEIRIEMTARTTN